MSKNKENLSQSVLEFAWFLQALAFKLYFHVITTQNFENLNIKLKLNVLETLDQLPIKPLSNNMKK